jgi:hypothetical protein
MLKSSDEISGVGCIFSVESEHKGCHIASFKPSVVGGLVLKVLPLRGIPLGSSYLGLNLVTKFQLITNTVFCTGGAELPVCADVSLLPGQGVTIQTQKYHCIKKETELFK